MSSSQELIEILYTVPEDLFDNNDELIHDALNQELVKVVKVKFHPFKFKNKETVASVDLYKEKYGLTLPNDYVKLITQYDYP